MNDFAIELAALLKKHNVGIGFDKHFYVYNRDHVDDETVIVHYASNICAYDIETN